MLPLQLQLVSLVILKSSQTETRLYTLYITSSIIGLDSNDVS